MTTPVFNMTDTWNNFATSFTAIKMSVTNAGSAADSKLLDLLLGGASRFNVSLTGTFARDNLSVGSLVGNIVQLTGSPAGSQGAFLTVDPLSVDADVNITLTPKGAGGILLYGNNGLQAVAAGPTGTTRYIILSGSVSGNPVVAAGGGGVVEIPNGFMSGAPTATTPLDTDNSNRIATTDFVKRQQYVQASPPTTANQLVGFSNPPSGTLIQGVDMPVAGLQKVGSALALADDLLALENLTGTHTIYYRSGLNAWNPVVIGGSLSFAGDTLDLAAGAGGVTDAEYIVSVSHTGLSNERVLTDTPSITWDFSTPGQAKATSAAGGGNVSNSGTPTVGQYGKWVTATTIQGVAPATVLTDIGAQPLDPQLSALAALTPSADQLPYYTAATTMSLTLLSAFARTLLDDTNAPLALATLGAAPIDSPTFIGTPTAPAPPGADSSLRLATTSFVKGQGYQTAADVTAAIATKQPLDGDLTAIAALTGTNTIYYRSALDTWSPVVIGTNLTFTGGTLAATGGGGTGNVSSSGTPSNLQVAQWVSSTAIQGVPIATWRTSPVFYGVSSFRTSAASPAGGLDINPAAGNLLLASAGTDADINFAMSSKGNGSFTIYNSSFSRVAAQFTTAPGSNTFVTFVGDVGNSEIRSNPPSNPMKIGSPAILSVAGNRIVGVIDGSGGTTGDVGEFIQAGAPSSMSLAPSTSQSNTSIALSAGDWQVSCYATFTCSSGNPLVNLSLNQGSVAVDPAQGRLVSQNMLSSTGLIQQLVLPGTRFSISAPATIYMVVRALAANVSQIDGWMSARRMR